MQDTNAQSQERGYELKDASVGPLLIGAALLCLVIVVCLFVGHWMVVHFEVERTKASEINLLAGYQAHPTAAVLQASTATELEAFQLEIEERVNGYGWVDRPNHIVRIPLERALELTLERGLPSAPQAPRFPR